MELRVLILAVNSSRITLAKLSWPAFQVKVIASLVRSTARATIPSTTTLEEQTIQWIITFETAQMSMPWAAVAPSWSPPIQSAKLSRISWLWTAKCFNRMPLPHISKQITAIRAPDAPTRNTTEALDAKETSSIQRTWHFRTKCSILSIIR